MENILALPVLVAAAVYWVLGALWYSVLFAGAWNRGLEKQGIRLPQPGKGEMAVRLVGTFVANLVTAIAVAWLVDAVHLVRIVGAVKLGLLLGVGVVAMVLASAYSWENKPFTNFLIDAGYHTIGLSAVAVIVLAWQ